jgi:hypothetical protein
MMKLEVWIATMDYDGILYYFDKLIIVVEA